MKRYRFALTFIISILLHTLLLVFFLQNAMHGLKKGVGENQKIKISSFEFASFDSKANLSSNPLPPMQKKSTRSKSKKAKKSAPKQEREISPKEQLKESTQQEEKNPSKEIREELAQETQEENNPLPPTQVTQELTQPTPQIPIEETLSYQLADAQTKKVISEFYGAEFGELGTQEQEYILNNLAYIGRITQSYLRYPPNAGMLAQSGGNAVEFYLHPNGDISDLKIIKKSGFILLDRNSIKTIEIAYKDYPHPRTKTLIRFYINYYLVRR